MYLSAAIQPGCGSKKKLMSVCCSTGTQAIGAANSSAGPRHASGSLPMIRSIMSTLLPTLPSEEPIPKLFRARLASNGGT